MQIDRDTIVKLARDIWGQTAILPFHDLEHFAKLVAEHEREACAKVCHDASVPFPGELQSDAQWSALCLATAIRARGKT